MISHSVFSDHFLTPIKRMLLSVPYVNQLEIWRSACLFPTFLAGSLYAWKASRVDRMQKGRKSALFKLDSEFFRGYSRTLVNYKTSFGNWSKKALT